VSGRLLAVTLGDPQGVGPEIIRKAWTALRASGPRFVVFGDREALGEDARVVAAPSDAQDAFPEALPLIQGPSLSAGRAVAVVGWIEMAVAATIAGETSGVVTAPISKAVLYEGGFKHPGHTELLAELTASLPLEGERGPVMMLTARDLRVVLATIHRPLREVASAITAERIVHTALVSHQALRRDFGIAKPRLALAGLNPHAGEGGAIGREEFDVLMPAVEALRAKGVDISEPQPADTLFHEEARRSYDAAVCLYHDQGLIPIKTLDFWGGVNVTLGLPIVRTSPDHGTGFDIAGKGIARADSLIAALRLADEIARRRAAT
jgi:4-hydroxythreonine-4-phosphate dehydrogenase